MGTGGRTGYRRLLCACAAAAALLCAGTNSAAAATIEPSFHGDELDTQFAQGSGCSLREAVQAINEGDDWGGCESGGGGPYGKNDKIVLGGGTFTLSIASADDINLGGDLDLQRPASVIGLGDADTCGAPASTCINANFGLGSPDRLLHSFGGNLSLESLTFTGGNKPASDGGCVDDVATDSALTITDATFISCVAGHSGGAVFGLFGPLTINGARFDSNRAVQGGGAVMNLDPVTIGPGGSHPRTVFTGNEGDSDLDGFGGGGALWFGDLNTGSVSSITDTDFVGNADAEAGAVRGNTDDDVLVLTDSSFTGNTARGSGAGAMRLGDAELTSTRSSFIGNRMLAPAGFPSAGALVAGAGSSFVNSTIAGNSASSWAGGLYVWSGNVTLTATTVAGNASAAAGAGGGIQNGSFTATQSIVGGNTAAGAVSDCADLASPVTDGGYNLEGGDTCGFSGTSLTGSDPVLAPPALNAPGSTPTAAPYDGSPAVDAIPALSCAIGTDQRGVARPAPAGGRCDIGAYEGSVPKPPPAGGQPSPPATAKKCRKKKRRPAAAAKKRKCKKKRKR